VLLDARGTRQEPCYLDISRGLGSIPSVSRQKSNTQEEVEPIRGAINANIMDESGTAAGRRYGRRAEHDRSRNDGYNLRAGKRHRHHISPDEHRAADYSGCASYYSLRDGDAQHHYRNHAAEYHDRCEPDGNHDRCDRSFDHHRREPANRSCGIESGRDDDYSRNRDQHDWEFQYLKPMSSYSDHERGHHRDRHWGCNYGYRYGCRYYSVHHGRNRDDRHQHRQLPECNDSNHQHVAEHAGSIRHCRRQHGLTVASRGREYRRDELPAAMKSSHCNFKIRRQLPADFLLYWNFRTVVRCDQKRADSRPRTGTQRWRACSGMASQGPEISPRR
jgi:hypothetical protein